MMRKITFIFPMLFAVISIQAFAVSAEFDNGLAQAKEAAVRGRIEAKDSLLQFNPSAVFKDYNPAPAQTTLYTGVKESSALQLEQQANQAMALSDTAKAVMTSDKQRPQFTVNLKTTDMQRSLLIQSEADNIVRGVTSQYVDCQSKQSCHVEYIKKSCLRSNIQPLPSCRKNLVVNVVGSIVTDSWSGSCGYLDQLTSQGICHIKEERCLLANSTKKINDVSVTRSCWEKQVNYDCQVVPEADDCAALDSSQCEQISSVCDKKVGDVCLSYQQEYRCPQNTCVNTANIVCGDGKDYCLNGDCTDHQYTPSQDFGKVLTSLSATNESSKSLQLDRIFKGKPLECRDDAGNFSNCCQGSGWGQDINLAHCSQQEKDLGSSREKNITVYAGRYCSRKIFGKCLEHKETYCVFPSKIAKVIQEQGRWGQLGIGFGDGKHSDCRGISPQELQRIDLSKVNFGKEIMDELSAKLHSPNQGSIQQAINDRVKQYQQTGQSNE